ncbi:hypothetical protein Lalb_Chr16g0387191 [Lupinus albus]|uniref:Uncharacterized protein n=1 Tax=Lupinus albus TaxID=3870 RepID=A0A6A4P6U7_LUPAL|nr:hypothetical protein Lalb_Chr16g0387191 [Lupinus albus]
MLPLHHIYNLFLSKKVLKHPEYINKNKVYKGKQTKLQILEPIVRKAFFLKILAPVIVVFKPKQKIEANVAFINSMPTLTTIFIIMQIPKR